MEKGARKGAFFCLVDSAAPRNEGGLMKMRINWTGNVRKLRSRIRDGSGILFMVQRSGAMKR